MSWHKTLLTHLGQWQGTNVLHDPNTGKPESSDSNLSIRSLALQKVVLIEYEWRYQDKLQEGCLLFFPHDKEEESTFHWVDTWHQSGFAMPSKAIEITDQSATFLGEFPVPPGPPWGWRTKITVTENQLQIEMVCLDPAGTEYPGVEASYTRMDTP